MVLVVKRGKWKMEVLGERLCINKNQRKCQGKCDDHHHIQLWR